MKVLFYNQNEFTIEMTVFYINVSVMVKTLQPLSNVIITW